MRWWLLVTMLTLGLAVVACASPATHGGEEQTTASGPAPAGAASPATSLPVLTFQSATGTRVPMAVEVADDDEMRTCGLMHRTSLPDEQGMIFIFRSDGGGGFWMRNTLIPLSVAFVTVDGTIVTITEMQPVPAPGYTPFLTRDGQAIAVPDGQTPPAGSVYFIYPPPAAPYRYAIEANATWYARHGLAVGDTVDVTEAAARGSAGQPPPLCRERGV